MNMRLSRSVWVLAGMLMLSTCILPAQDIFTSANGNWNATGNWSLGSLPGTNTATIGNSGYVNPSIANIVAGDYLTCSNLYLGNGSPTNQSTLNISAGSLFVTGTFYCANSGTGIVTQTGGTLTILAANRIGQGDPAIWTVSGGTNFNLNYTYAPYFGATCTVTVSGGVMSNASKYIMGYSSDGSSVNSTLTVTNTGVLFCNGVQTLGNGHPGRATINQNGGIFINASGNSIQTGVGSGTGSTLWTMTGGAMTNLNQLYIACATGYVDTVTIGGGVMSNLQLVTVGYAGNGTLNVTNGTFMAQGGITCAGAGTGTVTQTGGLIVSGGTIIIGSSTSTSTGLWTMANGVMTNNSLLCVGEGIQPGSLVMTNGTWWQGSSLYVGGTAAAAGTGAMTVANGTFLSQSNVFVAVHGSGAYGTLLVTNATFISTNAGTAFTIGTNGTVTVCGTQRVFQVAALTNFAGIFSNNIAQVAGGLDITTNNAGALIVTNNGLVTLVFSQNPVAPGNFWGLRWLGTNHVTALTAMHAASQLTWNDSQLSVAYQGQTCIYTDAVYTYVGINATNGTATVPVITAQPTNQIASLGSTATFNVTATGAAPLAYQWQKNGSSIAGATSMSYTTPPVTNDDNGATFTVTVTNIAGRVTSSNAILTVTNLQTASGYGPTLNFTDLVFGPNTGNTDTSLGQISGQDGAIVTVWGTGLGSSQGASTVMACGALATNIYYWGNAISPYSTSDMYTRHTMQMIVFQISHLASNGLGAISVTVNGQASTNTLPFTVISGTMRFVATTGSDKTGNGSWSNPYRTIPEAISNMAAGDITYVCNGVQQTTSDQNDNTTLELKRGGQTGKPMSVVGYPGATVSIGSTALYFGVKDWNGDYTNWTFAKLNITGQNVAIDFFDGFRMVGNYITAPTGNDSTGAATGSGNNIFFLGNEVTHVGSYGCSKLYHPLYVSSPRATSGSRLPSQANREIAWNYFHDNNANRAINIYSEYASTAFMSSHRVHDNFIINQVGGGMLLGDYMTGTNWVYNNVIANAGLGPDPTNGTAQAHFGVEIQPGIVATDAPSTVLYFDNNIIYGCGWGGSSDSSSESGCIDISSNNGPYTLYFENNIIVSTNQPYFDSQWTMSHLPLGYTSMNNLWYGAGGHPSWDTNHVLNVDPIFVSPYPAFNFNLASNSPAIDAGTSNVNNVVTVDFNNTPRPQGIGYDMGAYEYLTPSNAPDISGTSLLLVTMSSNGVSSLGVGPSVSASVPIGVSTQIVYTANEWYRIATLVTNGITVTIATGARVFTQTLTDISADVSNAVTFAMATPVQTGYTNVPTAWLTNWTEAAVQAALGRDGFSMQDKYLLGLDPTSSNSYRLLFDALSVSGSNVVIVVRRDVAGALSPDGMHGNLVVQGAPALAGSGFTNIPGTVVTGSQAFDALGRRTFTNSVNGAAKLFKATIQ